MNEMKNYEHISIPIRGFMRTQETLTLSAEKACQKINFDFKEYTCARKTDDGSITLVKDVCLCSSCNQLFSVPDNKDLEDEENKETINPELSSMPEQFFNWAFQLSFFEEQPKDEVFYIQKLQYKDEVITCPFCENKGKIVNSNQIAEYDIYSDDKITTISHTIASAQKYFLPNIQCNAAYDFPLEATISFFHDQQNATFELLDCNGKTIEAIAELRTTNQINGYCMTNHINNNCRLKAIIKDKFEKTQKAKIPFDSYELNLEYFILLTQFKGFPRNFYESIPYECETHNFEYDFNIFAKLLTNYNIVPELYDLLGFPDNKQMKKLLFENPALFFYTPEIKRLPFKNDDVLLNILSSNLVFDFLVLLYYLPNTNCFIEDLIRKKGEGSAWKFIIENFDDLREKTASYLIASSDPRDRVLKNSIKVIYTDDELVKPTFNLPVAQCKTKK